MGGAEIPSGAGRGPEAGHFNTPPEAAEVLKPVNHILEFLQGERRGTPRYKAAADTVALLDARRRSLVGDSDTKEEARMDIRAIRETKRRSRNEGDGADYEQALRMFDKVVQRYISDTGDNTMSGKAIPDVAVKMKKDWKEAVRAVDSAQGPTPPQNITKDVSQGPPPNARRRFGRERARK